MGEITFEFEELPLLVELGFEAGLVNGVATIRYHDDGEFTVAAIFLDGHKDLTTAQRIENMRAVSQHVSAPHRPQHKLVALDRELHQWLFGAILDQIENGKFADHIRDAISKELGEDGVSIIPDSAEHSMLHRAGQGV